MVKEVEFEIQFEGMLTRQTDMLNINYQQEKQQELILNFVLSN